MIRPPSINLARRPFRNNNIYYAVFGACLAVLLAASAYNLYVFLQTGSEIDRLQQDQEQYTARYQDLAGEVEGMKKDIATLDLTTLNAKSSFANGLILSHFFSWSRLFDRIEELIPPEVKIRSIRPSISTKGIEIQIDGLARTPEELYQFETALQESEFFFGVYPASENSRETKGEINFDLTMNYIPSGRSGEDPNTPPTPTAGLPQPEAAPGAAPASEALPEASAGTEAETLAAAEAAERPSTPPEATAIPAPQAAPGQAPEPPAAPAAAIAAPAAAPASPARSGASPVLTDEQAAKKSQEIIDRLGLREFSRTKAKSKGGAADPNGRVP